jgi:site-specific DNA recombinase
MLNIGIYMRYSTDNQELKVQEEEINKYIEYTFKDKEYQIKIYKDEGYSGKTMKRDDMIRLKNDIVANKINVVVALKLDRMSRSIQDLLSLFTFFNEQKIEVHLVKDKLDTSTAQGRLLFHIMGAFAEFERESISERLQSGKKYAADHGTKSGKPMNRPRKEINIKECIDLYKKGMSMSKLGKLYNVHSLTIKSRLIERGIIEK